MKTHRIEIRVTEREKRSVERAARLSEMTMTRYLWCLHSLNVAKMPREQRESVEGK